MGEADEAVSVGPAEEDLLLEGRAVDPEVLIGGQALGVVGHRDGRVGRPQVQTAGDRHDPFTGLALDLRPRLIGALGEPDVVGPVIGESDDPAVIGRGAVDVIELEPLEARQTPSHGGLGAAGSALADSGAADVCGGPVHGP